ncbi:HlyD family secretion protein [Paraburkholderia sp. 22B1P]|uniref:HlyD family secretion protein n=1 Tax=Paraburkholderia sp. 22B1P TaxID=3080498 RepID=UPI00308DBE30|nr:HlyD family secretion protein [Paraburkholderia sp. 22B1P]
MVTTARDATDEREIDSPGSPVRGRARKLAAWLGGILVVAVVLIGGGRYLTYTRFIESTDDAYVQADSTVIAPKVSGYVAAVLVHDNQSVHAGQALAVIDDRDYRAALSRARSDVQIATAELAAARAQLEAQSAVIAQSDATVAGAFAAQSIAAVDDRRYVELAAVGYSTEQASQEATARQREARASLQRSQAEALAARRQAEVLRMQVAVAQGKLAHAQAVEDQATLDLQHTSIVSPVDGVIGRRTVRVGQMTEPGTALMAVVPLRAVYVIANFKETQLTHMDVRDPVEIHVDAFPGDAIPAHVDSISPASGLEFSLLPSDNATGNFTKIVQRIPVKLVLNDSRLIERIRPGMSVEVDVDTRASGAGAVR